MTISQIIIEELDLLCPPRSARCLQGDPAMPSFVAGAAAVAAPHATSTAVAALADSARRSADMVEPSAAAWMDEWPQM
ncbi:hypothetical protein [Kitasatospora sp. NPDC059571]|uniref:hypothetical protein n=1 Tax=Kitasatospora sp. NPDC059571 TaxID=3346871 RepID=UPI003674ED62